MLSVTTSRSGRSLVHGLAWQGVAALYCFLFGLAIILNVQMGGESMWFWYATLFHQGVKLYADLHLVLQPLYVLETNAWIRMVGVKCISYEMLAVVHLIALCASMLLLLRESDWPDWQKAILMFGVFLIIIRFTAYRFDDFHVVADTFCLLGTVLIFWLARAGTLNRVLLLSSGLGILSGLAVTNRLTDGGVLLAAIGMLVPIVARRNKVGAFCYFVCFLFLTWLFVILLTGDTLHAYWTNSVIRASGAKGGTSSVLRGPFVAFEDSLTRIYHGLKRKLAVLALIAAVGFLVHRFWRKDARLIISVEVVAIYLLSAIHHMPGHLPELLKGFLIEDVSTLVQPLAYLLCVIVAGRALRARYGLSRSHRDWDAREAVVLVPAAVLFSAAVSQANSTSNSTITVALLFLILPCFLLRDVNGWQRSFFLTVVFLAGVSGSLFKVRSPYDWGSNTNKPMFVGRQWYQHPLYGPMYMDRVNFSFNRDICTAIGASGQKANRAKLQLLSIPFPYVNYFCGVTPWNHYVQLWYDTVTPATVDKVIEQLDTSPPQWILYQRHPGMIEAHEKEYNHNRPIPHHYLDLSVVQHVVQGRWKIVQKSRFDPGVAWYLIQTRP